MMWLLAPAVVSKNNLQTSCLSMYVLTKNYNYAYFKGVTNLFFACNYITSQALHNRDTLIEQSFIHIYKQTNGSAI